MLSIKKIITFLCLVFINTISFAQGTSNSTDVLKSNGKIYVVMVVVIVIVLGLFIYLFNLDRKVTKLEKEKHS
ncbi:MAG: CcmD family protein [Bacteroidetes bacterium]|nr:CcmD family protein [Bacteroidota bacterium]MBS1592296.1 CcmD family protein [Bacteroidota bacterium]MBS1639419.1 CcmD family protein [Bacteroidota bacterium]MBS1642386.1 CcmD family protein [Bacteroidota bacterium]MBS1671613.1 CcmD family protein [Bacteroidota bacterium]